MLSKSLRFIKRIIRKIYASVLIWMRIFIVKIGVVDDNEINLFVIESLLKNIRIFCAYR